MNTRRLSPFYVLAALLVVSSLFLGACVPKAVQICGEGNVAHANGNDITCKSDSQPTVADEASSTKASVVVPSSCRPQTWVDNAVSATTDTAALIAVVDRDFELADGGQWSEPGFVVPAGSIFWTDLFQNKLPDGVTKIRTQGGWGVYKTNIDYVIPQDNGGGRFTLICK